MRTFIATTHDGCTTTASYRSWRQLYQPGDTQLHDLLSQCRSMAACFTVVIGQTLLREVQGLMASHQGERIRQISDNDGFHPLVRFPYIASVHALRAA